MQRIGIRREDKNLFERRVPLCPSEVRGLVGQRVAISVQPSPRRVIPDEDFRQAGATVAESLDDCPIIIGVKEIPLAQLSSGKTYVFFSHTIKGQSYNMPLLRRLLDLGCTLIDYEKITDDEGRRLVFFGVHAGLAGTLDSLWALGQRLRGEGCETPFVSIEQAFTYASLDQASAAVEQAGRELRLSGVPAALRPLVFGVTGYGKTATGAQKILDLLQPQTIRPSELSALSSSDGGVYRVEFREEDMVEPLSGTFELQDYYRRPDRYRPVFSRYLEHLTVLMNCIYWEPRYPRLVTIDTLRQLYIGPSPARLRVIGDISCDIEGSVEATVRSTTPDRPVFVYDVQQKKALDGVQGCGPAIMAVENLPAELPLDASQAFSRALTPFIPELAAADLRAPLAATGLPAALQRAVIAHRGALTESFSYLASHL